MTVNTDYLGTPSGDTTVLSDLSMSGTFYSGAMTSLGAINTASAISAGAITGTTGTFSALSLTATSTGQLLLSVTTTSAVSSGGVTNLANNALALMESTLTNVTLVYRSGNTKYHWVSSAGSTGA